MCMPSSFGCPCTSTQRCSSPGQDTWARPPQFSVTCSGTICIPSHQHAVPCRQCGGRCHRSGRYALVAKGGALPRAPPCTRGRSGDRGGVALVEADKVEHRARVHAARGVGVRAVGRRGRQMLDPASMVHESIATRSYIIVRHCCVILPRKRRALLPQYVFMYSLPRPSAARRRMRRRRLLFCCSRSWRCSCAQWPLGTHRNSWNPTYELGAIRRYHRQGTAPFFWASPRPATAQ